MQAVDGLPGSRATTEQVVLERNVSGAKLAYPGVHAIRERIQQPAIGIGGGEFAEVTGCSVRQSKASALAIDTEESGAKQFSEATRARAPLHLQLQQAITRNDVSQSPHRVELARGEDVRHGPVVIEDVNGS